MTPKTLPSRARACTCRRLFMGVLQRSPCRNQPTPLPRGPPPGGSGRWFLERRTLPKTLPATPACKSIPQRLPLLPLIVKEPGSRSKNFSRSAATRSQVVRHSFRVIWVAASQSVKQVLSQKATRSFISWMSLADLSVEEDGCGVGLTGWATDLAKANSAARQRTKIQATPRMNLCPLDRGSASSRETANHCSGIKAPR